MSLYPSNLLNSLNTNSQIDIDADNVVIKNNKELLKKSFKFISLLLLFGLIIIYTLINNYKNVKCIIFIL